MGISSIITAGILSGALVFGQTASGTDFPKEIDEVTYNLVPVYVQEINWSDDSSKLNKMHTKSYIDDNGVIHLYTSKDYTDNTYTVTDTGNNENKNIDNKNSNMNSNNKDSDNNGEDKYNSQGYKKVISNINDGGNNNGSDGDSVNFGSLFNNHGISYQDMQEIERTYKNAGYRHTVMRFPVTKDEPYHDSKSVFFNMIPFDKITHIAVYGFASPDGLIPEMQEALAEKRTNKVLLYLRQEGITADNADYFVCDKSIARSLCWKVDVFYKLQ